MKRLLSFLLFLAVQVCFGANVDYRAFRTNSFDTNGFYVDIRTNRFPTFSQFSTNFFTSNNLSITLNTNAGSQFSNSVVNIIHSNVVAGGGSDTWTNDGNFLYPSGTGPNHPDGSAPGPPFVIRKDGSVFVGTNVTQDVNEGAFNVLYPFYAVSMVDSNEPAHIQSQWNAINNENYGYFSGFSFDLHALPDFPTGSLQFYTGDTNGHTRTLILSSSLGGSAGIRYETESGNKFVLNDAGELSTIKGVSYSWPATNLTAGQVFASSGGSTQQIYGVTLVPGITGGTTNFITTNTSAGATQAIASIFTNQFPNFISGRSNYIGKFTPNSNTMGNSIVFEAATNQWEWRSRPSGTAWTNSVTNRIMGQYTTENNFSGLEFVSSAGVTSVPNGSTEYSQIHAAQCSGSTTLSYPCEFMDAWRMWSGITAPGGFPIGRLEPMVHNTYDIGTAASSVGAIFSRNIGVINSSSGANVYGYTGYGIGMNIKDIRFYDAIGNQLLELSSSSSSGNYSGFNIGTGSLCANYFNDFGTPNIYLRGNVARDVGVWQMGTNHTSATVFPQAYTLTGPNASGTKIKGGDMRISGGISTGATNNGSVGFMTAEGVAASSTANTPKWREYIAPEPVILTESSPTIVCTISNITSGKNGVAYVTATTMANDGTEQQSVGEKFAVAFGNKSGTMGTPVLSASATTATFQSSGTLTTAWTAVVNANGIDLKNNAVSSLTQTTLNTRFRIEIDSDAIPAIYDGGVKH